MNNDLLSLKVLIDNNLLLPASSTRRYATEHYEVCVGIGKDHTATLTLDKESLVELCSIQNNTDNCLENLDELGIAFQRFGTQENTEIVLEGVLGEVNSELHRIEDSEVKSLEVLSELSKLYQRLSCTKAVELTSTQKTLDKILGLASEILSYDEV